MSDVEVKRWENKLLEIELLMVRVGKEFYFFGKEVALALDYANPKDAIQEHVDLEDKLSIEELLGKNYKIILIGNFSGGDKNRPLVFFQRLQKNYKVIKEIGLYSFCTRSRKPKAVPFQRWIFNTTKTIRETGFYVHPSGPSDNPLDLIAEVSKVKAKAVDKETQTQQNRKTIITREKETQTPPQNTESVKDSLERLKNKLEKSIKEVEFELKKSFGEISLSSLSRYSKSSSSSPNRSSSTDD